VFLDLASQAREKIGAEDFTLLYNLGVAHFQLGKDAEPTDPAELQKAIDYYEKALEQEPDEPTTMFNIVVAYVVAEDWGQAVTWGERYVGVKPSDPNGWRLLSRAYTAVGNDAKARQCATRYEELIKAGGSK
jgi:predicted Zn-dependent protease